MNNKKSKLMKYQELFRLYLRSTREDNEWSQDDLAERLGVSRQQVQKLESPSAPCKPVKDALSFEPFAALRGLSVELFFSALMGAANEDGVPRKTKTQFEEDLAYLISALSNEDKITLHKAIKTIDKTDSGTGLFLEYQTLGLKKRRLISTILSLSEAKASALLTLLKDGSEV